MSDKLYPNLIRSFILISTLLKYIQTTTGPFSESLKTYNELSFADFQIDIINPDIGASSRKKRSANNDTVEELSFSTTRLKFHAFDRDWLIYLKRDTTLVSDKIDIEVRYSYLDRPDVIEHADNYFTSNNYIGIVQGEPKSSVICYLEKESSDSVTEMPLLYAQIRLERDDKKEYFYIEPSFLGDQAKYVIYRSEDIDSEVMPNGVFNSSVCKPKYAGDNEQNDLSGSGRVVKRQAKLIDKKKKAKNRCSLVLVADYKFFKNIGNSNVKQTTAYLLNIIGAINSIYTETSWRFEEKDPDSEKKKYGFQVEKVIILPTPNVTESPHYNQDGSSTDSDKILQLFSEDDWSQYCLAHLFTFQGFDHSVLGLAYVSSPLSYTLGGICSRVMYRGDKKISLNIGLSSYKSISQKQGRLIQREAELVTAHEFGHNWGSEHDPVDSSCSPESGPGGGNFLMYAYSNQGHDTNNDEFSKCSINSISQVLKTKAKCFKEEQESYCGNGHVDKGEDCDPGFGFEKKADACCNKFCKFTRGSECSDKNHNCCLGCRKAGTGYECYSSTNYLDCFKSTSYCDGKSFECPSQDPLAEGSACESFDFGRCDAEGHCLSICQQKGNAYASCLCSNKEDKCKICCRFSSGNITSDCIPFKSAQANMFGQELSLSQGRPCFDGICNERVCEKKPNDYVTRFWKVIQKVTVSGFVEFMKRNIVGTIILISLSLWVPASCCVHFCIDKRNTAIQKQRIQVLQREIIQNRFIGTQSQPARSSNVNVRDRLLIRTEHPEKKQSSTYL